jgi:hypothetical protein
MTLRRNGRCCHIILVNVEHKRPCYVRQFTCFTYCWCSSSGRLLLCADGIRNLPTCLRGMSWWRTPHWRPPLYAEVAGSHTWVLFSHLLRLVADTLATSMPLLPSRFLRSKPLPQFLLSYGNRSGFSHKVLWSELWTSYFCKSNRSETAVYWGALPYILSVITSKQIRCVGYLALVECRRGSRNFSGETLKRKDKLEGWGLDMSYRCTCPYPEPDQSTPRLSIPLPEDSS